MSDCIFCKIIKGEVPCHNPVLWMRVLCFLENETPFVDAEISELSQWAAENIHLAPEDKEALLNAARKFAA